MICAKGVLLFMAGVLACAALLVERPTLRTAALLAVAIWSFARSYYFAFYVLEKYVDPKLRYSGLMALARHLLRKRRGV